MTAYFLAELFAGLAIPLDYWRFRQHSRTRFLLLSVPVSILLMLSAWANGQVQNIGATGAAMSSSVVQSMLGHDRMMGRIIGHRWFRVVVGIGFGAIGLAIFPPVGWITSMPFIAYGMECAAQRLCPQAHDEVVWQ